LRLDCTYRIFNRQGSLATGSAKTANISASGLLLEGPNELGRPGSRIDLLLRWPADGLFATLAMRGQIIRVDATGVGIRVMRHAFVRSSSETGANLVL
jgi:hypothetical protein